VAEQAEDVSGDREQELISNGLKQGKRNSKTKVALIWHCGCS
jgi:hypothetical protein